MTPVSVSESHIVYVDFGAKKVVREYILQFDKITLLREGLINYGRLIRRGQVSCVVSNIAKEMS